MWRNHPPYLHTRFSFQGVWLLEHTSGARLKRTLTKKWANKKQTTIPLTIRTNSRQNEQRCSILGDEHVKYD